MSAETTSIDIEAIRAMNRWRYTMLLRDRPADPVITAAYDALFSRCAELEKALREARSNLRHAEHCNSNRPMAPPQGFRRDACDCGCDYARNVATDALSANPLTSATGEKP